MHGTVVNEYTNVVHCCVLDWLKYFIPVFVFRCCWRDVYWHWASSGQVICNPPVTAPSGEATLKFMNTFSQQGPVWLKVIVQHKKYLYVLWNSHELLSFLLLYYNLRVCLSGTSLTSLTRHYDSWHFPRNGGCRVFPYLQPAPVRQVRGQLPVTVPGEHGAQRVPGQLPVARGQKVLHNTTNTNT